MQDTSDYMLTTTDNPWNPYKDYDAWYAFDRAQGYDTPGYLARIAQISNDLSDEDQEQAISDAIDEIVRLNVLGIYMKIFPETIIKV